MRIDIDTVATFSGVSDNALVATIDLSGAEYASIGIVFTAFTGSPTTVRVDASPADALSGGNIYSSGDIFGSPDMTGTPVAAPQEIMISRIGAPGATKATILAEGFLLPPPLKYVQIRPRLSGGSSPTATGSVVVWRYVR